MATEQDWQPIATAPKDGSPFIAASRRGVDLFQWQSQAFNKKPNPYWGRVRSFSVTLDRTNPPTHWMPLPDPPTGAK